MNQYAFIDININAMVGSIQSSTLSLDQKKDKCFTKLGLDTHPTPHTLLDNFQSTTLVDLRKQKLGSHDPLTNFHFQVLVISPRASNHQAFH